MISTRYALLAAVLAVGLGATPAARAANLTIDLSDHAARLGYAMELTATGLTGDIGILHHEEDGDVAAVGVHLVDDATGGTEPFTVGLGARAYLIDVNDGPRGTALGIGGYFRYVLPAYNRFALGGDLHYAPNVTSFGDTERFYEVALRAEYRVLRRGAVYLGWRRARTEFEDIPGQRFSLDNGLHLGLNLEF